MREMEREYFSSVKRSVVDYVLCNPNERSRLNLELLGSVVKSPETQRRPASLALPDAWRDNVESAREEVAWTLQTLSPHALELQALWEAGFAIRLLCDVSSASFRKGLPFEPEAFRAFQNEVAEAAKGALWTSWVPRTAELFRRSPPVFINNDCDAYYRSIAYLQGNQLRTLVRVRVGPSAERASCPLSLSLLLSLQSQMLTYPVPARSPNPSPPDVAGCVRGVLRAAPAHGRADRSRSSAGARAREGLPL